MFTLCSRQFDGKIFVLKTLSIIFFGFFRSMGQQVNGMKQQLDEARTRAAVAEEECAKLKEAVSRYQRRMSPAGANLFRPISSPVVTRKRLSQTGK